MNRSFLMEMVVPEVARSCLDWELLKVPRIPIEPSHRNHEGHGYGIPSFDPNTRGTKVMVMATTASSRTSKFLTQTRQY